MAAALQKLGLVVRQGPGNGRGDREQVDFALAAAAMEIELELFFLGEGLLQLIDTRTADPEHGVPPGHRAWAALPEMTALRAFAEDGVVAQWQGQGISLLLPVEPLSAAEMNARQLECHRMLVL